ncbi:uncharacterized protein J5F26_008116 isoform 3-T4 [Ciconia maguari]
MEGQERHSMSRCAELLWPLAFRLPHAGWEGRRHSPLPTEAWWSQCCRVPPAPHGDFGHLGLHRQRDLGSMENEPKTSRRAVLLAPKFPSSVRQCCPPHPEEEREPWRTLVIQTTWWNKIDLSISPVQEPWGSGVLVPGELLAVEEGSLKT